MYMRAGGLPPHCLAEREERDAMLRQVFAQPDSFGLIGMHRHVNPAAMVESKRAMYGGFAVCGNRQRLAEIAGKSRFHPLQNLRRKDSIAIEPFRDIGRYRVVFGELHL